MKQIKSKKGPAKSRKTKTPGVFETRLAKKIAAYTLIGLGASATIMSGIISVSYASHVAWFVVGAFIFAELGELVIPVVGGLRGWDLHTRVTLGVCMVASSFAIVGGLYDAYAPTFFKTANDKEITLQANTELAQANATLARLMPMALGNAASLKLAAEQTEHDAKAADTDAKAADAKAATERSDVTCGKKCAEHERNAATYRAAATDSRAKAQVLRANAALADEKETALAIVNAAKVTKEAHQVVSEKSPAQMGISFVLVLMILKLFPFFTVKGMSLLSEALEPEKVAKPKAASAWEVAITKLAEQSLAVEQIEATPATWATVPANLSHMSMIEGKGESVKELPAPEKKARKPRKPRTPKTPKIETKKTEVVDFGGKDKNLVVFVRGGKKKLH